MIRIRDMIAPTIAIALVGYAAYKGITSEPRFVQLPDYVEHEVAPLRTEFERICESAVAGGSKDYLEDLGRIVYERDAIFRKYNCRPLTEFWSCHVETDNIDGKKGFVVDNYNTSENCK